MEKIKEILGNLGIENWRVTEVSSETAELYFIKKNLDMPRYKKRTSVSVEVFRDFEEQGTKYRGSSNASLEPGMTDGEIKERLEKAFFAAGFVKNKWYPLPASVCEAHRNSDSGFAGRNIENIADEVAEALFSADTAEDAFINSCEIFVKKIAKHITASNGLDVSFDTLKAEGELVAQCISPLDVEQHRNFSFDRPDRDGLKDIASQAIDDVRKRANSTLPPKAGNYDVILRKDHVREILSYYLYRGAASMVYPGYSSWKTGMKVQGESGKGEKLNISLIPTDPYSGEGIPMRNRELIQNGELRCIWGNQRFCSYIGTEPTGGYEKISCQNGSASLSDMRKDGVLELISFSDFQMDPFDGHFKGEIRLAILHKADGITETLTGGSVNGSLPDAQNDLIFSLEKYSDSLYEGPYAVLIPGVPVAGA